MIKGRRGRVSWAPSVGQSGLRLATVASTCCGGPLPLALLGYGLAYAVGDGVGYAFAPTVPPRPRPRHANEDRSAL